MSDAQLKENGIPKCPACMANDIAPDKATAFVLGCYVTHLTDKGVAVVFCDKHDVSWKEIEASGRFDTSIQIDKPKGNVH